MKKEIEELKEIRIRLTQIYMKLGNPKELTADILLRNDIQILEFKNGAI